MKKEHTTDSKRYVKTLNELATALKVTRQTVFTWRKLDSSPKTDKGGLYCVDDWLTFQDRVRKKDLDPDELNKLKIEKLKLENEERQLKIDLRKGELISRESVRTAWMTKISKARSVMQAKLELEMPPLLVGLDAPAIQEKLQEAIHEILRELSGGDKKSLTP